MKTVRTETGFECQLDESTMDDMELFDAICELDAGKMTALPTVVDGVLGEHKKALYDHCRGENGRASVTRVLAEVVDIIKQLGKK